MIDAALRLLSPRGWMFVGGALLVFLVVWWILAWGQSRYDAGVEDTDAKWVAASERLKAQAEESAAGADENEVERVEDHNDRLAAEREKIDEAVSQGRSPLDGLFPSGGL